MAKQREKDSPSHEEKDETRFSRVSTLVQHRPGHGVEAELSLPEIEEELHFLADQSTAASSIPGHTTEDLYLADPEGLDGALPQRVGHWLREISGLETRNLFSIGPLPGETSLEFLASPRGVWVHPTLEDNPFFDEFLRQKDPDLLAILALGSRMSPEHSDAALTKEERQRLACLVAKSMLRSDQLLSTKEQAGYSSNEHEGRDRRQDFVVLSTLELALACLPGVPALVKKYEDQSPPHQFYRKFLPYTQDAWLFWRRGSTGVVLAETQGSHEKSLLVANRMHTAVEGLLNRLCLIQQHALLSMRIAGEGGWCFAFDRHFAVLLRLPSSHMGRISASLAQWAA